MCLAETLLDNMAFPFLVFLRKLHAVLRIGYSKLHFQVGMPFESSVISKFPLEIETEEMWTLQDGGRGRVVAQRRKREAGVAWLGQEHTENTGQPYEKRFYIEHVKLVN